MPVPHWGSGAKPGKRSGEQSPPEDEMNVKYLFTIFNVFLEKI